LRLAPHGQQTISTGPHPTHPIPGTSHLCNRAQWDSLYLRKQHMMKIAIIGAGLSGLSVARRLKEHAEITLFEKARGVSGRMSTRRAEPYYFDHGAQYFTARTKAFQASIQPLIDSGLIERWNGRYVKFRGDRIIERRNWLDDEPRYVGVPAMNQIAKYLAEGLYIHLNARIASLKREDKWQLFDENGLTYGDFDWVISTAPSAQTAAFLPKTFKYHADIRTIEMRACFSLMLGFSASLPLAFDAAHVTHSDLSWIAVNSSKPGRAGQFSLVVHSSERYAEAHFDANREKVIKHLSDETSHVIGHDVSIADCKALHGWRYANNAKRDKYPVFLDANLNLAACGDWCQGGRVEGAFTSADNLATAIEKSVL
jgi:renalase